MKKKKLVKKIVLSIIVVIASAFLVVFIWSTILLDKTYPVPLSAITVPKDSTSILEGKHLVEIEHCSDCHGARLTGDYFFKFVAPNLIQIIPAYSNAELERLIKYGVKKNGQSVYGMEAAFMYHQLTDTAIAEMIAYLRTLPAMPTTPGIPAKNTYGFWRRLKVIRGRITPEMIKPDVPRPYIHYDTSQISYGEYLTMTTCTSCHGRNLKGEKEFSPDLIIATAYSKADFYKLIRTGIAVGNRKVGWMTRIAKNNLHYLSDKEINAIYSFLQTKPTLKSHQILNK